MTIDRYSRYESGQTTGSTSHNGTGPSSPNKSKDHSALLTPPIVSENGYFLIFFKN